MSRIPQNSIEAANWFLRVPEWYDPSLALHQAAIAHIARSVPTINLQQAACLWYGKPVPSDLIPSLPQPQQSSTLPKPEPQAQPAPQPPRDRGRAIEIPVMGTRYTNDKIDGCKHFTWGEATKGGSRVPQSLKIAQGIIRLAAELDLLRAHLGCPLRINSWYRPPAVNRAVNGAPNSTHLSGYAADFFPIGLNIHTAQNKTEAFWGDRGGVGRGARIGFVHVDLRNRLEGRGAPRWNYG